MWVEGLGINGALGEGVEFMWGFEQGEKKATFVHHGGTEAQSQAELGTNMGKLRGNGARQNEGIATIVAKQN
jgi:hypothetical protein